MSAERKDAGDLIAQAIKSRTSMGRENFRELLSDIAEASFDRATLGVRSAQNEADRMYGALEDRVRALEAERDALRKALFGDDPELPNPLTPLGTLEMVVAYASERAEAHLDDEDPSATLEALCGASAAIRGIRDAATRAVESTP